MPLQNRVLPTGEIVADPAYRGRLMGNRGVLHDDRQELAVARWRHKAWIACLLDFKGRKREPMTPGRYTELFFLDEAVALAAGHRPCAECRRTDFRQFREAWEAAHGACRGAGEIDRILHRSRVRRNRQQVRHEVDLERLPDGAFVMLGNEAYLVCGPSLLPFSPTGYGNPKRRDRGLVTVLTPAPTVAVLEAGYTPGLHPSACWP